MLTHMFLYSYTMTSNFSRAITSYARHKSIRPVTTYAEYLVIFFFHVLVVSHTCLKHTPMKFYLPYLVRATVVGTELGPVCDINHRSCANKRA